jgi:hypothetical protein
MFKLTETEWRTKFTLYFKEIRKLKFTMPFHSECRKAKSLIHPGPVQSPDSEFNSQLNNGFFSKYKQRV